MPDCDAFDDFASVSGIEKDVKSGSDGSPVKKETGGRSFRTYIGIFLKKGNNKDPHLLFHHGP
jgi:hypothetical protein